MPAERTAICNRGRGQQRGAALMIMLVIIVMGTAAFLVSSFSNSALQIARDQKTAEVLAQAKDALIGSAVIHDVYPGSLPCPDTDDDGVSDAGGADDCPDYIGRLPWKTLGLDDLRDAAGERLWYTLSRNVRRYSGVRPLNSDTTGTLNITGTYIANNLIAIVFAPGSTTGNQTRSKVQTAYCATTVDIRKESWCATNYIEGSNATPSPGSGPNPNYQNANAAILFNDQLITISYDQLFPLIEKRIAKEISNCLRDYASANHGNFPWATPLNSTSYDDNSGQFFGRLPSLSSATPLSASRGDTNNPTKISNSWPSTPTCIDTAVWWDDWKELIFYSVSNRYSPNNNPAPANCDSTCLTINPPSAADKKAVIIVAGKALSGQIRTSPSEKANVFNYLEGNNFTSGSSSGIVFEQRQRSSAFNDTLLFQ